MINEFKICLHPWLFTTKLQFTTWFSGEASRCVYYINYYLILEHFMYMILLRVHFVLRTVGPAVLNNQNIGGDNIH